MGPTALLPFRRKSCCWFLSTLKTHRPRPGLNLRSLDPVASTITVRPPRTTTDSLYLVHVLSCPRAITNRRPKSWINWSILSAGARLTLQRAVSELLMHVVMAQGIMPENVVNKSFLLCKGFEESAEKGTHFQVCKRYEHRRVFYISWNILRKHLLFYIV
jgi:hypothetical protein